MNEKQVRIPTPIKSHRLNCLDCTSGQVSEIRHCAILSCACWPYRMGRRPGPAEIEALRKWKKEKNG